MRVIVIFSVCLSVVTAVPANPHRIVGGVTTTIGKYPGAVSLQYAFRPGIFSHACGGTILSEKYILTAAHCTIGDKPPQWQALLGSTFLYRGGTIHCISAIEIHPDYNSKTHNYDVSIITTSDTIKFSKFIQPAPITDASYTAADGKKVYAVGWGTTCEGCPISEQLRDVQIHIVNRDICDSRYAPLGVPITKNMLCSGMLDVGGRDQCQGDSGGPLYHNNNVIGVCSFGLGCARPDYPGVNAYVPRMYPWISSIVYLN